MSASDDAFLQALRATFSIEAAEHLQTMAGGLLQLETEASPEIRRQLVEGIFRAAHSLKGASRSVNLLEVEAICQTLEDTFSRWKRSGETPPTRALDAVHRALDEISRLLARGDDTTRRRDDESHVERPRELSEPASTAEVRESPATLPGGSPSVRVPIARLDAFLLEVQELLSRKLAARQRVAEATEVLNQLALWQKRRADVQLSAGALRKVLDRPRPGSLEELRDSLNRVLEFLDWNDDHMRALDRLVAALVRATEQDRTVLDRQVDDLLKDSRDLLMLPITTLGALFPRLVRDLCRDSGREARMVIEGDELEIDKRILEEMKDPLIHLLRNCVDHGIETPEERRRMGKPARATIRLAVSPVNGSKVEFRVSDDGAGIDTARVRESAVRRGLVTEAEAMRMSESEAAALVFKSEVSSKSSVTPLSGRGLGLAIVQEKAATLGGTVTVETRRHIGTTIRIVVPTTLATFRGVLVEAGDRCYIVPMAGVERVARIKSDEVRTVEGQQTVVLDGRTLSLTSLADLLELPASPRSDDEITSIPIVVLNSAQQRLAMQVDAILDEQEILVKPFRKPLVRVRNVGGATVLASGQVVPILNVTDLLRSARKQPGPPAPPALKPAETVKRSILVVEDSITSRTLLKGILESAGYHVRTAIDGVDAFTTLRTEHFDLVVSDVEMPRMNGFDLTARIRADRKLADLPVVLLSALENRADRERGVDVGASAYLVKSGFDQGHLLETVRRWI